MEDGVYTVRRGDTVSLIAARYGLTEQRLLGIDGIQDRHRIYPGQELRLPGVGDEGASLAVIDGNLRPTPPTEVQFADEAVEVEVQNAGDDDEAVVITPVPEIPETDDPETNGTRDADASPEQLALVNELLPPAASTAGQPGNGGPGHHRRRRGCGAGPGTGRHRKQRAAN